MPTVRAQGAALRGRRGERKRSATLDLCPAEMFQRYGAMVYRRALTLLGSKADAEDATQDIFTRALNNQQRFRGDSDLSTWLYRITTNVCLNVLRNRSRRAHLLRRHADTNETVLADPVARDTDPVDIVTLRNLLQQADPKQAGCAVCVYVDGMTRDETAQALGVSLRTVGNLLNRFNRWARGRLREPPRVHTCAQPPMLTPYLRWRRR